MIRYWPLMLKTKTYPGPYSPAVLRFTITFPPDYPTLPPTITITTEIFHPLVAPLTTYTYTTRSLGTDTVSATDEERLPPGGFSLRHGFPCWFGRARKSIRSSAASSRNASISDDGNGQDAEDTNPPPKPKLRSVKRTSQASSSKESSTRDHHPMAPHSDKPIRIIAVLEYMKQAFEDEAALDTLPLDAAGNSGAWKAWRAHRKSTGEDAGLLLESAPKQHDDWNWDGVWEERVRKGIDASISEPTLYSGVGKGDDLVGLRDIISRNSLLMHV